MSSLIVLWNEMSHPRREYINNLICPDRRPLENSAIWVLKLTAWTVAVLSSMPISQHQLVNLLCAWSHSFLICSWVKAFPVFSRIFRAMLRHSSGSGASPGMLFAASSSTQILRKISNSLSLRNPTSARTERNQRQKLRISADYLQCTWQLNNWLELPRMRRQQPNARRRCSERRSPAWPFARTRRRRRGSSPSTPSAREQWRPRPPPLRLPSSSSSSAMARPHRRTAEEDRDAACSSCHHRPWLVAPTRVFFFIARRPAAVRRRDATTASSSGVIWISVVDLPPRANGGRGRNKRGRGVGEWLYGNEGTSFHDKLPWLPWQSFSCVPVIHSLTASTHRYLLLQQATVPFSAYQRVPWSMAPSLALVFNLLACSGSF